MRSTLGFKILFWVAIVAALGTHYAGYLSGRYIFFHDSIPALTSLHLFYDSIFSAKLPLWSPYLNAGSPLWPVAEVGPSLDPIGTLVWFIFYIEGGDSVLAYQWACVGWLLLFSLGGAACSYRLTGKMGPWLITFIALFAGPLSMAMVAQSHGFLNPFRYTPWILFFVLKYLDAPSSKRLFVVVFVLICSLSGYQSVYSLFFVFVFTGLYLFYSREKQNWRTVGRAFGIVLLCLLVVGLPSWLAAWEYTKQVPLGRLAFVTNYAYHASTFFRGLVDFQLSQSTLHGNSYLGMVPIFLIGFFLTQPKFIGAEQKAWVVATLVSMFLALGGLGFHLHGGNTFLGMRNWGFLLTLVLLGCCQIAAMGWGVFFESSQRKRISWVAICLTLFCFGYLAIAKQSEVKFVWNAAVLFLVISLCVLLWKVRNRQYVVFGICILALIDGIRFLSFGKHVRVGRTEALKSNAPRMGMKASYSKPRSWRFPTSTAIPYHYESPSVRKVPFALLEAFETRVPPSIHPDAFTPVTHFFRTKQFQAVLDQSADEGRLKEVFSVGKPIIRVHSEVKDSKNGVVEALGRTENAFEISVRGAARKSFVHVIDGWDRYWMATINGKSTSVLALKPFGKAVPIPEGDSLVSLRYVPTPYIIGFWIRAGFYLFSLFCLAKVLLFRSESKDLFGRGYGYSK